MASLFTKDGVPLRVSGDRVYNDRGDNFGYVKRDRVYGLDGRYRGTVIGDRLIYRSTHSASISGSRASSASGPGSARAHRAGSTAWGDEPDISP